VLHFNTDLFVIARVIAGLFGATIASENVNQNFLSKEDEGYEEI